MAADCEPLRRAVARAALLDGTDRVLLLRDPDPDWGGYWYLPGGRIEHGETPEEAARREVFEEIGIRVDVGPLVHRRRARFVYRGTRFNQEEWHFIARLGVGARPVTRDDDNERLAVEAHRWWTMEDLRATSETVYPEGLASMVESWLASGEKDI